METTQLTRLDVERIYDALLAEKNSRDNPFMHAYGDIDAAIRNIVEMDRRGQVVKFRTPENGLIGILIYDIVNFWWSDEPFFSEVLVLKTDPTFTGGFGRMAIRQMERIAKDNKCVGICSGCILERNAPMVTNMYKKAGFQITTANFVKDLRDEE
ncbi:MAG: hypothetical protein KHX13_04850 [Acidaminococcus intestini]|uniref:Uncharacterized protein n=1 Tax=Acidaminococcus intestini TaxID=187327 RepID=A0A943EJV3_9FIRM|nr:hypothetical protein [Acidaminococcus intestini]